MFYDPMISKLCTHSNNRESTINEMLNALDRYFIEGVETNKDFLSNILQNKNFSKESFPHLLFLKITQKDIILMI